ncbi:MAG: prepilin-type N-terminal cleavage/methylation domain-containing protein [Candidatus Omnitrophica bacterium]|nr:prepilin-type N-terminal cleavage/methylation domain-containing protein [Candidatus Omnitrophota bacterium]
MRKFNMLFLIRRWFKSKNNPVKIAGFTLLEIIISTAVFSIIIVSIFEILMSGSRIWLTSDAQLDIHSYARVIMQKITNELKQSAPEKVRIITVNENEDSLLLQTPAGFNNGQIQWSNQIQFSLGGEYKQQLVRTVINPDNGQVLEAVEYAEYITGMHFNQLTEDRIEVVLVLERNSIAGDAIQLQLVSQVAMRNQ